MGKQVQELISINGRYKIRQGEVKNSRGNGEAIELICRTHEYELRGLKCWWEGGTRVEGNKVEKKMDNYNRIINEIY